MSPSSTRVAFRHLESLSQVESALDGMPRSKAVKLVNHVIDKVHLKGFFHDEYWHPIHAIWKEFEKADIPYAITFSQYEKEKGVPVRKVWSFEVNFRNDRGNMDAIFGRVVAAGAGSVEEPLSKYDVVAYAN